MTITEVAPPDSSTRTRSSAVAACASASVRRVAWRPASSGTGCPPSTTSILEVATALCDARDGSVSPVITGQYRSGDVRHIVADPTRAGEVLGFRAAVDPRDGLREFIAEPITIRGELLKIGESQMLKIDARTLHHSPSRIEAALGASQN